VAGPPDPAPGDQPRPGRTPSWLQPEPLPAKAAAAAVPLSPLLPPWAETARFYHFLRDCQVFRPQMRAKPPHPGVQCSWAQRCPTARTPRRRPSAGVVNLAAVGSPGSGGDGCSATIELLHVAARRYNAGPRRLIRNLQECLGRPRLGGLFCVSRTSSMSNPQNL
jgi:hypothetical protein